MSVVEAVLLAQLSAGSGAGCGPSARRVGADVRGDAVTPFEIACDADRDGFLAERCAGGTDCDDADASAHPGAAEALDGADDDCDGAVDDGTAAWDADGDCVCAAPACSGSADPDCAALAGGDCDDTDPLNFPGNPEVCDGADNDCDQLADEELPALSWWPDVDADGFGSRVAAPLHTCADRPAGTVANNGDCDDLHASVGPHLAEVACDGLDNDCDPSTPDGDDHDRDGVDHCLDCDDDDPDRSPAHEELCNDRDDDCDGEPDDGLDFDEYWRDGDGDGYGDEDGSEIEACEDPGGWVSNDDDCDDGNSWVNPGAVEWHCDGVDNDCSGGDRCP